MIDPYTTTQKTYTNKVVCPYEGWQLVIATEVYEWAFQQCLERGILPHNMAGCGCLDDIRSFLYNTLLDELRFLRLQDYDTDELEAELQRRKEGNDDNNNQ